MMLGYSLLIFIGLLGSAYYSGLETGVLSVNRLRLRHLVRKRKPGAEILDKFLQQPDYLLGTTLVGNNLCNVITSVIAVGLGTQIAGTRGYVIAYLIMTITMLVFGEYLPKAWFRSNPADRVLPWMKSLQFNGTLFYPVSKAATWIAQLTLPVPTDESKKDEPFITVEELKHLTKEGEQTGVLTTAERKMIESVFDLTTLPCKSLMIPREEIILVDDTCPAKEILQLSREHALSRFPVLDNKSGKFTGIVYIFDLLTDEDLQHQCAGDYMRTPQFENEDTPCDEILSRMQINRQPMALIVNENSEVSGLTTSEHILDYLVGKI